MKTLILAVQSQKTYDVLPLSLRIPLYQRAKFFVLALFSFEVFSFCLPYQRYMQVKHQLFPQPRVYNFQRLHAIILSRKSVF